MAAGGLANSRVTSGHRCWLSLARRVQPKQTPKQQRQRTAPRRRSTLRPQERRAATRSGSLSHGASTSKARRALLISAPRSRTACGGSGLLLVAWSNDGLLVTIRTSNGVEAPEVARGCSIVAAAELGGSSQTCCAALAGRVMRWATRRRGAGVGRGEARRHSDEAPGRRRPWRGSVRPLLPSHRPGVGDDAP
jgi:hypothetical protein